MPHRTLIELEHVSAAIAGHTILRDVTLAIAPGERYGIVGANGSGKTTLLRVLAGRLWPAPDSGARRYDFGRGPERDAVSALAAIQYVGPELQDRYVRMGGGFRGVDLVLSGIYGTDVPRRRPSAAERHRAFEVLRALRAAPLADRRFVELSRGEQRRVLIARALAASPAALVLDEPASALDARARSDLEALLAAVADDVALIVSAHTRDDLPHAVTRIVYLDAGRLSDQPRARAAVSGTPAVRAATALGTEPLVVVERASVWRNGRRALADVDFRLEQGQQWLVKGANGAGKSTFLKLLHGALRPATGGAVRWPALGDPRDVWTLRRQIGWVAPELQADYAYPTTVRECIASGFSASIGAVRAPSEVEAARIAELLGTFELEALAGRKMATLSYGQARRALLARAFAQQPRLLLLDEPWEGLDAAVAALLEREIEQAIAAGSHVVCASHIEPRSLRFTHELRLDSGRVIYAGVIRPR